MNCRTTGSVVCWISSTVPTCAHPPFVEHRDAGADGVRAAHVVRDDDARDAESVAHADHELVDDGAGHRVEARGRLIVQDVLRAQRDRARDADALAHAAGQLGGKALVDVRQVDEVERLVRRDPAISRSVSSCCLRSPIATFSPMVNESKSAANWKT